MPLDNRIINYRQNQKTNRMRGINVRELSDRLFFNFREDLQRELGEKFLSIRFGDPEKVKSELSKEGTSIEEELKFLRAGERDILWRLKFEGTKSFRMGGVDLFLGPPLGDYVLIDVSYLSLGDVMIAEFSSTVFDSVPEKALEEFINGLVESDALLIFGWSDGQVFLDEPSKVWEVYGNVAEELASGRVGKVYSRLTIVRSELVDLGDGEYETDEAESPLLVETRGKAKLIFINPLGKPSYRSIFSLLPKPVDLRKVRPKEKHGR